MRILRQDLTQTILKEYLEYEPGTGRFIYLKKTGKKSVIGAEAGSISKRDGHKEIRFFGTLYRANQLAWFWMTGNWEKFIDHEDHDELNNRWNNLRAVTQKENNMNMSKKKTNTSGVTGVWWSSRRQRWVAEIMLDGVKTHLGVFSDINLAALAREQAERVMGFHPNHGKP